MAPLELNGNTLGEKHQHYNKLVEEALNSNQDLQPLDQNTDDDIQNLVNIDIACRTRNVNYILEVLKTEDNLYVSKAIKRSSWLITDPQYANIINPEYLYTELYPQVTLKTFNKLMLHVRLNLKDEKRVESFYNFIKERADVKFAHKWLPNCSAPLIEEEVKNVHEDPFHSINIKILRRLFRKSFSVYEAILNISPYYYYFESKDYDRGFKIYSEEILNLLENCKNQSFFYRFGPKTTKILMKQYQERILRNFGLFGKYLHTATLTKYLNSSVDVRELLLKHAENINLRHLYSNDRIQHFIKIIPKDTRFEFVRKLFIDKEEDYIYKIIADRVQEQPSKRGQNMQVHMWYKFAPFEVAYEELNKLIKSESVPQVRSSILQVLLSCAGSNTSHIRTVLQYYHDKHFNEAFKFKNQFVNHFISQVDANALDDQSWNLLCKIFHSMEVFIDSENNVQPCVNTVIIRNVLRKEPVPDIIERKIVCHTIKPNKLKTQEEKEAVFKYLENYLAKRSDALNLTLKPDFEEAVNLLKKILQLIKDWGRQLQDHPNALARVKELIKIREENQWSQDLSVLYTVNKTWRKQMFEESTTLIQNEAVFLNVLKHDPCLLARRKDQILATQFNHNVSFRNLLRKIRIYWPQTLAVNWKTTYSNRLSDPYDHKASINGLCALLSQEQIIDLLRKYAPSQTKIDWNETDQVQLSLSKEVAKNIHKARPLPPIQELLKYAKGDYLQYVVPSISAVLSQLSPNKNLTYIPVLLDSPMSLKKFGLRIAINKLNSEQLKPILSEIWNKTKNKSVRTVIIKHTFQMLCNGKHACKITDTWDVLSMFIDKISHTEDKTIYKDLGRCYLVPKSVQPQFFMKSFAVISSLPGKCNCQDIFDDMLYRALDYVEFYDNEFVVKCILNNFNDVFDKKRDKYDKLEHIVPAYILASRDEVTQIQRYDKTLDIILDIHLPEWEKNKIIKDWIQSVLGRLISDLEKYTFDKKMTIPLKVFEKIQARLENTLPENKFYELLTIWKLATAFVKVLYDNNDILTDYEKHTDDDKKRSMFNTLHEKTAPLFAKLCVQYLQEDIHRLGHSIYLLMAAAYRTLIYTYLPGTRYEIRQSLLYQKSLLKCENSNYPELHLFVYHVIVNDLQNSYYIQVEEKKICIEIYNLVMVHCSNEIKILFNDALKQIPLFAA